jgi:hypothetical protein
MVRRARSGLETVPFLENNGCSHNSVGTKRTVVVPTFDVTRKPLDRTQRATEVFDEVVRMFESD